MNSKKESTSFIRGKFEMVSYCGVFCGACPSLLVVKSCLGCGSENHNQKRISKWGCKIRNCCIEKGINSCAECEELPCSKRRRLDNRYLEKYHIDLVEMCSEMEFENIDVWIAKQYERWNCEHCGGIVDPYERKCNDCGKNID